MTNILITGVGGQGTVLASKLIAGAALSAGVPVRTAETIGMAQRGGSVVSHVRIGGGHSPLIPLGRADVIIAFEPGEAVRCLPYLKDGGAVISADCGVTPVSASLSGGYDVQQMISYLQKSVSRLHILSGDSVVRECGSIKALNVALLGAACTIGVPGLNGAELLSAIERTVPQKFIEMNRRAFELGVRQAGK